MTSELLGIFGDDLMVVNVARVSYGKQSLEFSDKDRRLIDYLIRKQHTSPFRHPQIQYRIQCPIFVERQLFKHQIGMSANSISGRYVDFSDSYYTIKQFRKQSEDSKQGSGEDIESKTNELIRIKILNHTIKSQNLYEEILDLGVSKEQARTVLPLNLNTMFIWTGSLLAFLHLFDLRLKPDAQKETRDLVQQMKDQLIESKRFEATLEAWENKI